MRTFKINHYTILNRLVSYTGMFTKNWHICFTIFTEANVARMNLRIPNDSAINGNLFNRRLNYTISISQPRQDIFDMASFLAKLKPARCRRILIVFLHVSTDPARAAAPTDLLNCVRDFVSSSCAIIPSGDPITRNLVDWCRGSWLASGALCCASSRASRSASGWAG